MNLTHDLSAKISMLIKTSGKTQAEVAEAVGMPASQLSKFLNGHSEFKSENLLRLLNELEIDVTEIVSTRLRAQTKMETQRVDKTEDAIQFLLSKLDRFGRETVLSSILWVIKSSRGEVPEQVQKILREEMRTI